MEYISVHQVLDDLFDNPLLQDLSPERAINYTQEFIRIVGMPEEFEEKIVHVEIRHHRGKLPCDLHEILGVRNRLGAYRYTTDTFHSAHHPTPTDLTYKKQGRIIITSTKEIDVEVCYNAVKVDEDGFPMVPDNASFIKALELYIKLQCYTTLFELGKVTPAAFQNVQQEYAWYVGQAQTQMLDFNSNRMQSMSGMLNQLIPRKNEFRGSFAHAGRKEYYKAH